MRSCAGTLKCAPREMRGLPSDGPGIIDISVDVHSSTLPNMSLSPLTLLPAGLLPTGQVPPRPHPAMGPSLKTSSSHVGDSAPHGYIRCPASKPSRSHS